MHDLRGKRRMWGGAAAVVALGLLALLAGCGGAASSGAAPDQRTSNSSAGGSGGVAGAPGSSSASGGSGATANATQPPSPQYLIKSLAVNMTAKDPRVTAIQLQAWIVTADPKAVSAGLSYTQDGASYDVSMTFSVEASVYPQVESYLAGYAEGHGGKLLNLQETVQDVTNSYVDDQSRLSNLRGEQQRLQALMGQAGSLGDVLTIEQRLTDVEGQIEDIQTHLALLAGQTAYYTAHIQLSPLSSTVVTPPQPWNPGQVLGQAWGAAVVFGQWLLTLLIWLGVFALYIVPALVIYWLARRFVARRRVAAAAHAPQGS